MSALQISFHFNVSEPADYVCRLIRKACGRQLSVLVWSSPQDVVRVDQALWAVPTAFLPHAVEPAPEVVRERSPVYLCQSIAETDRADVLINLQPAVPPSLDHFGRLIEIVTPDADLRAMARQRWRHYAALGWVPEGFDAAAS